MKHSDRSFGRRNYRIKASLTISSTLSKTGPSFTVKQILLTRVLVNMVNWRGLTTKVGLWEESTLYYYCRYEKSSESNRKGWIKSPSIKPMDAGSFSFSSKRTVASESGPPVTIWSLMTWHEFWTIISKHLNLKKRQPVTLFQKPKQTVARIKTRKLHFDSFPLS